ARDVAEERKEAVLIFVIGAEVVGLEGAAARNPDGRTRLLERSWPQVDVAQLGVLAVEREDILRGPRLDDQVVGLVVLLADRGRDLAVAEVGIHRGADRKSRDQAPARD